MGIRKGPVRSGSGWRETDKFLPFDQVDCVIRLFCQRVPALETGDIGYSFEDMDRFLEERKNIRREELDPVLVEKDCRDSPLCGCPEKKFARKVLELRMNGLDHRQIAAYLLDEYGIELFPADILSFLEESVHVLEAISDVSRLQNRDNLAKITDDTIHLIER